MPLRCCLDRVPTSVPAAPVLEPGVAMLVNIIVLEGSLVSLRAAAIGIAPFCSILGPGHPWLAFVPEFSGRSKGIPLISR
jgi:hypothetical protein